MFEFFKKKRPIEKDEHKIVSLPANDAVLQTYQEKAQDELQYLIDFMNNNERDEELFRYAIKANFIEGDNCEHMWVQVYEFKDDYFFGQLANEPNTIELLKYGDNVKVFREDVEDWILEDFLTNTKVGDFASIYIKSNANKINGGFE
ncbi:MAG TPA: DUF2314 domain-containing protein [Mucilaginibacter sp.]|jgi:uncharacterized protein YegJ (DUF2314 family)|nr:DUF2314 domain-containing protein [Mucilaginibacter sp.]